ncbi:MAG: arginase [Bacteroidetes bacterium]|nr:MAG: arginase [Bacteroidota bacterium]
MDILAYFDCLKPEKLNIEPEIKKNKYALYHIDKNLVNSNIKKLDKYKLAIIGVPEERNTNNKGTALAPDIIREKLYYLNRPESANIVDLGNLKAGKTLKDTYVALGDIVAELISMSVIPIIIGGSQDLTYGNFLAYQKTVDKVNLVSIDPKFDIGFLTDDFDSSSYLGQIILHSGENLFNHTNLGYQAYYLNKEEKDLMNKLNFDSFRLGKVRENIKESEPILRDADILSIDISAVKQAEAPAFNHPSANGFYGEELCQLSRYAGLSDRLSSFGIYNVNPKFDVNNQTVNLCAQVIWYFIEGVTLRQNDYPEGNLKNYTKFIVNFDNKEQNIIFYRNINNDRWWMEIPNSKNNSKNKVIACSYEDYKLACTQELPERWIRSIQKMR